MYLQNKYTKCYNTIINRAKSRPLLPKDLTEKHHIVPKSLGGSNNEDNLVPLTLREHFICHLLLPKMTTGNFRNKMVYAAWRMCHSGKNKNNAYNITSRAYDAIKTLMRTSRTSKDFTPEWKQKISDSRKGQTTWNKGVTHTVETRKKLSESRKAKRGDPTWNIRPACSSEKAELIRKANVGKKWVHNPLNPAERKQLNSADSILYLLSGWKPGTGPRTPQIKKECPRCQTMLMPGNFNRHLSCCKL